MIDKPHLQVAAALVLDGGLVLIARRGPDSRHPGRWEFPGGKQEEGESLRECLTREIMEELNLDVEPEGAVASVDHDYGDLSLTLHAYLCRLKGGSTRPGSGNLAWVRPEELEGYDLLPPDREIVKVWLSRKHGAAR
ncbi:MAG: (deoxy)nucleoside triphosphate pyrophosphohydrolase [Thermodesulfobacteriota bacterium]